MTPRQEVKLFLHDLSMSRPRVHVDDEINRYLQEHPNREIKMITYNTRELPNKVVREEALVVFDIRVTAADILSGMFDGGEFE